PEPRAPLHPPLSSAPRGCGSHRVPCAAYRGPPTQRDCVRVSGERHSPHHAGSSAAAPRSRRREPPSTHGSEWSSGAPAPIASAYHRKLEPLEGDSKMNTLQSLTTLRFPDTSPRSRLERFLAHLADVRAGEGVGVLLLALNLFLLLAAYYMLKTVREALILTQGGAEVKTYSAAGQAILLLAIVPAFGAIASRVNRVRLVTGSMLFFASNLVVFAAMQLLGVRTGVAYF